ncbi:MAG: ABC transporter permease [Oscillospiraceae bacterium]|jgi:ABC-type transport system involved in multi-copper enzyme maturation permease subunit|nr:ABC transporter permease [Oscillospiraceae bacterium]
MGKLIRAEFLKLRKSLGYKVLFLCAMGLGLFVGFLTAYVVNDFADVAGMGELGITFTTNGFMMLKNLINDTQTNVILISIFSAIFISGEFADRTYGIALYSGVPRWKVLASKVSVYLIAILPMIVIYPVSGMLAAASRYGFGTVPDDLLLLCLRCLLGFAAVAGFCVLMSVLIKNVGGVIGACIGGTSALTILNLFPKLEPAAKFSFMYQLAQIGSGGWMFLGVMIVTLVVSLVLAAVLFERAELK